MMTKIKYGVAILIAMLAVAVSCKKDDAVGPTIIPPRDRGEEAIRAQAEIEAFLETHFYNYEEFQADPENFKIKFDTIDGDNASKIKLITQVDTLKVKDRVDTSVEYTLYYLKVREGEGDKPHFSDITTNTYEGRLMNLDLFDSSVIPVKFDLIGDGSQSNQGIIRGLREAILEFKGASEVIENPDGTLTFKDYGIGSVFIPSGLGYFQYPPASGGLNAYDQLIFSFELIAAEVKDHELDGVPSYMEDLNDNQYAFDDDTDGDGVPNYIDTDDDGDGRLTRFEIEINNGIVTFPDKNGNGIPDYLDPTI